MQKNKGDNNQRVNNFKDILNSLGSFFIELFIPFFISMSIWYIIIKRFELWSINEFVFLALYLFIAVGGSLLINAGLRTFIEWGKQNITDEVKKTKKTKGQKLLKNVITVISTIALGWMINIIPVSPNGDTFLVIALNYMKYQDDYPFIPTIGDLVITADSNETKLEGINTLVTIHTPLTLTELFRVLEEDHASLNNLFLYGEFSSGIATYNDDAKENLLNLFFQSEEFVSNSPRGVTPNLYGRFFEQAFIEIRDEISRNILDSDERVTELLNIDKIELQLKLVLIEIEEQENLIQDGDSTLDFVLDTFYLMEELNDSTKEIYFLAKNIAVDPTYAKGTRIRAILLWAKLGEKEDLPLFVDLLNNSDERLQQAALQGINIIIRNETGDSSE